MSMGGRTDPNTRNRVAGTKVSSSLWQQFFGTAAPVQAVDPPVASPFYIYHPGDVFYPGGAGWVLDQKYETPVMPQWGNGSFLANNPGIQPFQGSPVTVPNVPRINGVAGSLLGNISPAEDVQLQVTPNGGLEMPTGSGSPLFDPYSDNPLYSSGLSPEEAA